MLGQRHRHKQGGMYYRAYIISTMSIALYTCQMTELRAPLYREYQNTKYRSEKSAESLRYVICLNVDASDAVLWYIKG